MRNTRTRFLTLPAAALAAVGLFSCSPLQDEGLSSYEDQAVQEQTAAAMSVDEGGTIYAAETLADPATYEALEDADPQADGDTGYRTVSWTVNFPYYGTSTEATMRYKLMDASGNVQSSFNENGVDTYYVEASLTYSRVVDALRYSATTAQTTELSVEGLQTGAVTINGDARYDRDAQSSEDVAFSFTTHLSTDAELENLALVYSSDYGRYVLSGGTAATSIEGSMNNRSFSRSASWTFQEGYQATMNYEGEHITVNVETGAIVE